MNAKRRYWTASVDLFVISVVSNIIALARRFDPRSTTIRTTLPCIHRASSKQYSNRVTDECEITSIFVRLLYSSSIFHGLAARSESMQRSITRVAREVESYRGLRTRNIERFPEWKQRNKRFVSCSVFYKKKKWNDLAVSDEDSTRLRERERERKGVKMVI